MRTPSIERGELDHALQVVGRDAEPLDGARRHGDPGQPEVGLDDQGLQRLGEEPRAALGRAGVDLEIDLLGIHAGLEQLGGDPERPRPRVAEAEAAGVGQDGHVESARAPPR